MVKVHKTEDREGIYRISLPEDVVKQIVYCMEPLKYSKTGLYKLIQDLARIRLTCHYVHEACNHKLKALKEITPLVIKYHRFNDEHPAICGRDSIEQFYKWSPPLLLDAVSTGLRFPSVHYSVKVYTDEVEIDIKKIVELLPKSIHCNQGSTRVSTFTTPLYMASWNANIPLRIIELLLKKGANPFETIITNGVEVSVVKCLSHKMKESDAERFEEIKELFIQYTKQKDRIDKEIDKVYPWHVFG